jgi:hypothetical protein
MTATLYPDRVSWRIARRSRFRLLVNFSHQNLLFDFGMVARSQPAWWCQKHPWTKTAHFPALFAKSGEPGSLRTLRRYETPLADPAHQAAPRRVGGLRYLHSAATAIKCFERTVAWISFFSMNDK